MIQQVVHEFVREWGFMPDQLTMSERLRVLETRVRYDYHPAAEGMMPVVIFTHLVERIL